MFRSRLARIASVFAGASAVLGLAAGTAHADLPTATAVTTDVDGDAIYDTIVPVLNAILSGWQGILIVILPIAIAIAVVFGLYGMVRKKVMRA